MTIETTTPTSFFTPSSIEAIDAQLLEQRHALQPIAQHKSAILLDKDCPTLWEQTGLLVLDKDVVGITEDHDHVFDLFRLVWLMGSLQKNKNKRWFRYGNNTNSRARYVLDVCFTPKQSQRHKEQGAKDYGAAYKYAVKQTLLRLVCHPRSGVVNRFFLEHYKVDPRLPLFCTLLMQLQELHWTHALHNGYGDEQQLNGFVRDANRLVKSYRGAVNSEAMQAEVYGFHRASRKSYASFMQYLDRLFGIYSKLLVTRVDLHYGDPIRRNRGEAEAFQTELQSVIGDRKALFEALKKHPLLSKYVGYAWKLEYAPIRGLHYHLILMLNGREHQNAAYIGKLIGELWMEVVAQRIKDGVPQKGYYWNCCSKPSNKDQDGNNRSYYPHDLYSNRGTGVIDHHDADKRAELNKAIGYLTKTDQFMYLACQQPVYGTALTDAKNIARHKKRQRNSKGKMFKPTRKPMCFGRSNLGKLGKTDKRYKRNTAKKGRPRVRVTAGSDAALVLTKKRTTNK